MRFNFSLTAKEKKTKKRFLYIQVALSVCFIVLVIVAPRASDTFPLPLSVIGVVIANTAIAIYTTSRDMGKIRFIEISEEHVEWKIHDKNMPHILLPWSDVRRIKNNDDHSISFYMDSSFSQTLPIDNLSNENQMELIELVRAHGSERKCRLVGF